MCFSANADFMRPFFDPLTLMIMMTRHSIRQCALFGAALSFSALGCNDSKTVGTIENTGGTSAVTNNNSTGGSPAAGTTHASGGANAGGPSTTGCTGSFETVQSSTGLCVAVMVPITAPSASENYSIDATEVTKGQYDLWLATNPALPTSADVTCGFVTSYAEQSTSSIYTGTDAAHHPVVYVDWCDAYAYCKGVGKRLCGAIAGGTNAYASYADATLSQWYRACSLAGADSYPYGNTYQATNCDGADYGTNQTVSVGSLANCVTSTTGYAGAYDLSGNVYEWEDSCRDTSQSAACHIRGGSFLDDGGLDVGGGSGFLTCGDDYVAARDLAYYDVGFRCCAP